MQQGTPEAFLAAITESSNHVTQGWMRLMEAAPSWVSANAALQAQYVEQQTKLWNGLMAGRAEALAQPEPGDRRFAHREWRDNPYFDYLKQSYLLAARYLESVVESAQLEEPAKERARFAMRQWIDAVCPANFPATNPQALEHARETNGESLARGMANLLADARRRRISQVDESAFEVGRNVATTRGEVVYENELIQLIQYAPTTPQVGARPLVMIPPCINKFYVLDLQPENSFAGYAVANGHTVFMVSWRNVGESEGHLTWDDYLEKGVFTALRVAKEVTGADRVNALGFCVGGTLLGAGLAALKAKKEDLVESVTLLATMLDFAETGQIGLFIDEASVAAREATIGKGGILPGADLAFVFSSLRANDLVWPYVVNNYLLGQQPAAFDLLYWNADSTNLPGPMYCYYLRKTYLENSLKEEVDFGSVELPLFVLATREDHIVPWKSAYRSVHLLGGKDKTFVLGHSGHIAGVINPAAKNKRGYAVGSKNAFPQSADEWLEASEDKKGSWWPVWAEWLGRHAGEKRDAPKSAGSRKHRPIEAAPGRYVKHRII